MIPKTDSTSALVPYVRLDNQESESVPFQTPTEMAICGSSYTITTDSDSDSVNGDDVSNTESWGQWLRECYAKAADRICEMQDDPKMQVLAGGIAVLAIGACLHCCGVLTAMSTAFTTFVSGGTDLSSTANLPTQMVLPPTPVVHFSSV